MNLDDEWADFGDTAEQQAPPPGPPSKPPDGPKKPGRKKRKKKAQEPPPELVFPTVADFVADFLAPTVRRNLRRPTVTWCPAWWRHPEAVTRLTALWRAWEHLRHDPALGMSVWWLHHADPHLRVLMDKDAGPLSACTPEGHRAYAHGPLPVETPDAALWLSPAFSAAPPAADGSGA
ncbi:DUF4913 domain-containing protein [Streptomyces sp. NPDC018045]|uniref:DUF4913 domain-containing protein n=1 Tax=Streptomyces sp. NPDC018045 TaxID=3365037 RepID=UPI0037B0FD4F